MIFLKLKRIDQMSKTFRRKKSHSEHLFVDAYYEIHFHNNYLNNSCFDSVRRKNKFSISCHRAKYKSDCFKPIDTRCLNYIKKESNRLSRSLIKNDFSKLKKLNDYYDFLEHNQKVYRKNGFFYDVF